MSKTHVTDYPGKFVWRSGDHGIILRKLLNSCIPGEPIPFPPVSKGDKSNGIPFFSDILRYLVSQGEGVEGSWSEIDEVDTNDERTTKHWRYYAVTGSHLLREETTIYNPDGMETFLEKEWSLYLPAPIKHEVVTT